jgi:hypothetical protein
MEIVSYMGGRVNNNPFIYYKEQNPKQFPKLGPEN